MTKKKDIEILKELKEFIIPLSEEEFGVLEKSILSEGCREHLIVWKKGKTSILVDGHNRLKICLKHNIPYKVKAIAFNDIDQVKDWMIDNQMGRRNLTPDQLSYYRGVKYLTLKKAKGGYVNVKLKGQTEPSTSGRLAEHFNVSESTIKRDSKFAAGLGIIAKSNVELKTKILTGTAKAKKADIQILADYGDRKIIIKNEADLFNKAKLIREEMIEHAQAEIKKIQKDRIFKAQQVLKEKDLPFSTNSERLKSIKANIVSSINRAINEKDLKAIKELKKLVEKLESTLFQSGE